MFLLKASLVGLASSLLLVGSSAPRAASKMSNLTGGANVKYRLELCFTNDTANDATDLHVTWGFAESAPGIPAKDQPKVTVESKPKGWTATATDGTNGRETDLKGSLKKGECVKVTITWQRSQAGQNDHDLIGAVFYWTPFETKDSKPGHNQSGRGTVVKDKKGPSPVKK